MGVLGPRPIELVLRNAEKQKVKKAIAACTIDQKKHWSHKTRKRVSSEKKDRKGGSPKLEALAKQILKAK